MAGRKHFPLRCTALRRHPVLRRRILGGQHHLTGLQGDAVTAFEVFKDFFSLFASTFDDLGQLFEQGFGHGREAKLKSTSKGQNMSTVMDI
ncbi:MAG: hypothetical protein Q7S97_11535 [Polaromonas sp.]|nr:hypothetical protein [Polaromonas sp.]